MSFAGALDAVAGPLLAVAYAVLALSALTALPVVACRLPRSASSALAALGCLVLLAAGLALIATGLPVTARAGVVLGFDLIHVRYDALGAVLLVALGAAGTACSLYAVGYAGHRSTSDPTAVAFPVFLASLALVFGAAEVFAFLFAWELMALSSAALVMGVRPEPAVARTAYLYLVLTHLATGALVVAFGILAAAAGSTDFATFGAAAAGLPPIVRDLVFVLLLLGFGTKAGAIPLHVWLPRAHPVAPSHVSALMSGVMVKAGIYGLVRFGLEILGPGPEWWGLVVLTLGVVSAVLGVLYALTERDLKRLLAFSSIENVGVILIGVGVALLAEGAGATGLAALALTAALFHALNHALFKSVLFLAAGSIASAAGTRDLDALGGLARAMPVTAIAFAIGAAAISGLPPLNGFAGEWLTLQGLIGAGGEPALSLVARSAVLVAAAGLALAAALALACFVKATGMSFLALPRSTGAAGARETARSMGVAMSLLAIACVGVGAAAGPVAAALRGVARGVLGDPSGLPVAIGLPVIGLESVYAAAPLAILLALVAAGTWAVSERGRPARTAPTWTCGIAPEPAFEYTATSYGTLFRLFYGSVLRPANEVRVEHHPGTPFPRTIRYRGEVRHLIDERVYGPLHQAAVAGADFARRLQSGSLQLYLAYTVAAVVALLLLAR